MYPEEKMGEHGNLIEQNSWDKIAVLIRDKQEKRAGERRRAREERREEQRGERAQAQDMKFSPTKERFVRIFYELCEGYFDLAKHEIADLDDRGVMRLESVIAKRALRDEIRVRAFYDFPLIGWFAQAIYHMKRFRSQDTAYSGYDPKPTKAWSYRFLRAMLKHAYGRNWFPLEKLQREYYRGQRR